MMRYVRVNKMSNTDRCDSRRTNRCIWILEPQLQKSSHHEVALISLFSFSRPVFAVLFW